MWSRVLPDIVVVVNKIIIYITSATTSIDNLTTSTPAKTIDNDSTITTDTGTTTYLLPRLHHYNFTSLKMASRTTHDMCEVLLAIFRLLIIDEEPLPNGDTIFF